MPHDQLPGEAEIVVKDMPVVLMGCFVLYSASNTHCLFLRAHIRVVEEAFAVRLP